VTTPSETVVEVLSDGSQVVEITTTESKEEEYYVQIQGSDRKHPAIVLRRRDRGKGATIRTISKFGQHAELYADYEAAVSAYVVERAKRLDNTQNLGEEPGKRNVDESGSEPVGESWIDQALQGVVGRLDNSPEDTD